MHSPVSRGIKKILAVRSRYKSSHLLGSRIFSLPHPLSPQIERRFLSNAPATQAFRRSSKTFPQIEHPLSLPETFPQETPTTQAISFRHHFSGVKSLPSGVREHSSTIFLLEAVKDSSTNLFVDGVYGQSSAYLIAHKLKYLPLVAEDGSFVELLSREDVKKMRKLPVSSAKPSLGSDGKFLVGAAIDTRESDKQRLEHLVKAGVDVIVLDSSQGDSVYQREMINYVTKMYPKLDVIAGNVVTTYLKSVPKRRSSVSSPGQLPA